MGFEPRSEGCQSAKLFPLQHFLPDHPGQGFMVFPPNGDGALARGKAIAAVDLAPL